MSRVYKTVHLDNGLTERAEKYLERIIDTITDLLIETAFGLIYETDQKTLTSREIQSAVQIVINGELCKHAVAEGTMAVTRFYTYRNDDDKRGKRKEEIAGITFPVTRFTGIIKKKYPGLRVGEGTPVYLSTIIEYLTAEILQLAGDATIEDNRKRINMYHIVQAINKDGELTILFNRHQIAIPHLAKTTEETKEEMVGDENQKTVKKIKEV